MIWASLSHITSAIWFRVMVRVRVIGDAQITRVLGMGTPKTRGCPYHCNNTNLSTDAHRRTNSAIWPVPYTCTQPSPWQWQPWTAVSPLLGLISLAKPSDLCTGKAKVHYWAGYVFAKASGIVSGEAVFSYWPISFSCPQLQSQKSLRKLTRPSFLVYKTGSLLHGKKSQSQRYETWEIQFRRASR